LYSTVDVRQQRISPNSKILFVSQESSADVVQEAFRLGALGYVAKTQAGIELLAAVEAVCQGRRACADRTYPADSPIPILEEREALYLVSVGLANDKDVLATRLRTKSTAKAR
jgi:DNA-binding NarL/FixJ family response regulator